MKYYYTIILCKIYRDIVDNSSAKNYFCGKSIKILITERQARYYTSFEQTVLHSINTFSHISVLLQQALAGLNIEEGDSVADLTFGFGGHSREILGKIGQKGTLYAFDRDAEMIERGKSEFPQKNIVWVHDVFSHVDEYIETSSLQGLIADLGVSSYHFDNAERGFSFTHEGPLDMRLDQSGQQTTAKDIIDTFTETELANLFKTYGEEKLSKKIAKKIKANITSKQISTTTELARIIDSCYPSYTKTKPATRCFQALRIFINDELGELARMLEKLPNVLASGGTCAFITFHSLEDRIVKQYFQRESRGCICPPEIPVCRCTHKAQFEIITKKPIIPSEEELQSNRRARSAKLRIYKKK
jgi:16S rRNA (cytosine1402-N4)-methyltransferase